MAYEIPPRLLHRTKEGYEVLTRRVPANTTFDILSYRWGDEVEPYDCGIPGVTWKVKLPPNKIEDIQRLMTYADIDYLWVDCVCLNQEDDVEKRAELPQMYQYYQRARRCYVLLELEEIWSPQSIVEDLWFVGHVISKIAGTMIAPETALAPNTVSRLSEWTNKPWTFPLSKSVVAAAAVDLGVVNCYSSCVTRVMSVFESDYFRRVWTFQEMLLGKDITLFAVKGKRIESIGRFDAWMDLATDCKDKAHKLREWIRHSRYQEPNAVVAVMSVIDGDYRLLNALQIQVMGISAARTDIIMGGPHWWRENYTGVSNVFSAACITPRKCRDTPDVFLGLLGVFSGLFSSEEVEKLLAGSDMNRISFVFFKQLSWMTGYAWTTLATSGNTRKNWDWIPAVPANSQGLMTTDVFSGVVRLGKLNRSNDAGEVNALAMGISGFPRSYMRIRFARDDPHKARSFRFVFHGCNCGKEATRWYSCVREPIQQRQHHPQIVSGDETGRILVQCSTILGSLMDPGKDVVQYRRRLLEKLMPEWTVTDPIAKAADWIDRCVNGTGWERPQPNFFKVHNRSVNYRFDAISGCESRLDNANTAHLYCIVEVKCGCTIIAPFAWIFTAITAVEGSPLGGASATIDPASRRISLSDGLGLVQVEDTSKAYNLVAFAGDVQSYSWEARACRTVKLRKPVEYPEKFTWPRYRALMRQDVYESLAQPGSGDGANEQEVLQNTRVGMNGNGAPAHVTKESGGALSPPGANPTIARPPPTPRYESQDLTAAQLIYLKTVMRTFAMVENTGDAGNLLICKKTLGPFKIVGACIDGRMTDAPSQQNKVWEKEVTIR